MNTFIKDLGNGLILRRAAPEDAQALGDFNARIHSDNGPDMPDERVGAWTRDLLTRPHPTFKPEDFTIIEETAARRIVSSMNLISQTWTYAGVPFKLGRPELVGTLPEFRNRGLVRIQFDEVHKWSAARGEPVQAITGIPYYYRLFGYEMTVVLDGRRFGYEPQVPKLKAGEQETFRFRPATPGDLAFVAETYAQNERRCLLSCQRSLENWRYELDGQSAENVERFEIRVIETTENEPVGYLLHHPYNGSTGLSALGYGLKPGVSWLEVTPAVARYLWETGQAYAGRDGRPCTSFGFTLGVQHPAYEVLGEQLPTRREYAYFMRVPDLPAFLRLVTPVLEERLAKSLAVGYTGSLRLSFYKRGLRLAFERGRLVSVEDWQPSAAEWGEAAFPELTFLHLLFGHRSLAQLREIYPDCWTASESARLLLSSLFPVQPSHVWPLS